MVPIPLIDVDLSNLSVLELGFLDNRPNPVLNAPRSGVFDNDRYREVMSETLARLPISQPSKIAHQFSCQFRRTSIRRRSAFEFDPDIPVMRSGIASRRPRVRTDKYIAAVAFHRDSVHLRRIVDKRSEMQGDRCFPFRPMLESISEPTDYVERISSAREMYSKAVQKHLAASVHGRPMMSEPDAVSRSNRFLATRGHESRPNDRAEGSRAGSGVMSGRNSRCAKCPHRCSTFRRVPHDVEHATFRNTYSPSPPVHCISPRGCTSPFALLAPPHPAFGKLSASRPPPTPPARPASRSNPSKSRRIPSAPPARIELATNGLGNRCSIH